MEIDAGDALVGAMTCLVRGRSHDAQRGLEHPTGLKERHVLLQVGVPSPREFRSSKG